MADQETGSADRTVLVVSDDPLVRDDARYGFPVGIAVSFAVDSRDAARLLEEERPSVVVVDMQTGNAGGYSLARHMAESAQLDSVPILILLERDQDRWLARKAGASAYRTKPLRPGELARQTLALIDPG
ncbi:MAG: response regulator [Actinomycetota bacterium]